MLDVITFGEAFVDLPATTPDSLEDAPAFEKVPAGGAANVAAAVARLGGAAGFVGKAGDDPFGRFLKKTFTRLGVDTSRFHLDREVRTGLAFVSAGAAGERQFYFDPELDVALRPEDLDPGYLRGARVFHLGTLPLIAEPARTATFAAVDAAGQGGALVSLGPDLCLPLWPSEAEAHKQLRAALLRANLVELSEGELQFLYPGPDVEGVQQLLTDYVNIRLVAVTYGAGGSVACTRRHQVMVRAFSVDAADGAGAGDAFTGALCLHVGKLCDGPAAIDALGRETLRELVRRANAAGALATTRRGRAAALPTEAEVESLLARTRDNGASPGEDGGSRR